jgi:hypothetical protein
MTMYNVTLNAVVNVRVPAVEAPTQEAAIEAALDRIDLHSLLERHQPTPKVEFTSYGEEVNEALVDEVGDEIFEKSRWFIWRDGRWTLAPTDQLEELRLLDQQAQALRKEMGHSQPGEVIWQTRLDFDELLVVAADGYGRASLLRVSGNYPVEYTLKDRREFDSEDAACAEAGKQAAQAQT